MMLIETLLDVSNGQRHSRYFNQTRSHYLFRRVRVIALLLAFIQPAWLIVDHLLLPEDVFQSITIARLAVGGAFLLLAAWGYKRYSLSLAYFRLSALVLLLSAFHMASSSLLLMHGHESSVAGYHFFPFMIICMMAIFPLAIVEVVIYTLFIVLLELMFQLFWGVQGDIESMNNLWLLSVLGMISGWAAVNQLNMLLGLYRQATRDPLTGLSNRRQAMDQLTSDVSQNRSSGQPLSVMLFDLDKFKVFNDTYGHAAGDIVLKAFAKVLRTHARKRLDLPCRYGGEEFLMVLSDMNGDAAAEAADQIRQACHEVKIKSPSGESIGFSTSVGVAELKGDESIDQLLQRADEALYTAKDQGRDQVKLAE